MACGSIFGSGKRLWEPPSFLFNEYSGLFPLGVKRQGREADRSPSPSAEIKKDGATPPQEGGCNVQELLAVKLFSIVRLEA
jgi:hypothetical protein